jgi:hypothetical protein
MDKIIIFKSAKKPYFKKLIPPRLSFPVIYGQKLIDQIDPRAEIRSNSSYGLASLNLTNIKNEDRGWYNCKVLFLDRSPEVTTVRSKLARL